MKLFSTLLFALIAPLLWSQILERNYTIPVVVDGVELANPWAGGLNYCQFSKVDIDMDGEEDLFVFDRLSNRVSIFITESTTEGNMEYRYTREFNHLFPADLKNWVFMRDFNCDGKKDIFTNLQSGLRIFINTSTVEDGFSFEALNNGGLIFANYDFGGNPFDAPVYTISPDLPGFVDYDGDGDTDIITFTETSTTMYYFKSMQVENGDCDTPSYICANRCFGKFSEATESFDIYYGDDFECSFNVVDPRGDNAEPLRHTGGTVMNLDLNQDGILDLVLGDVSEPNLIDLVMNDAADGQDSAIYVNLTFPSDYSDDGGVDMPLFPGAFYEDVNNDGIRDLIVSPNANVSALDQRSVFLYLNEGQNDLPAFNFLKDNFLQDEMIDVGLNAFPVLEDMSGDGLLDLLIANRDRFSETENFTSQLHYYRNTGTPSQPAFELVDDNYLNIPAMSIEGIYPTFGDIDGDGDKDLMLGDLEGMLYVFINSAGVEAPMSFNPATVLEDNTASIIDVGQFAAPQLVDINGDGDLDLMVGEKNGNINYYENIGTVNAASYTLVEDSVGDVIATNYLGIFGYSVPFFFKNENDEFELLVGTETGLINHYSAISGNINGIYNLVTTSFMDIKEGDRCAVFYTDINDDEIRDLVYGQIAGGLGFYLSFVDPEGVEEISSEISIKLYPNPATSQCSIVLSETDSNMTLNVMDMTGRILATSIVTSTATVVDVSDWSEGVYLIQIISDRWVESKQLVIKK